MEKCTVMLNNGYRMPKFGLGTFQWFEPNTEPIEAALRAGYRLIDCAAMYENEVEIGETLQKCFQDDVVKREDLFITSKLWNDCHENVVSACQLTLKNLQLNYLDLYLVHYPISLKKGAERSKNYVGGYKDEDIFGYDPERIAKCWQGMEELVELGLVKSIGVSNFTITKTERLLETAKIVPAVNQVECHLYFQQQKLKMYLDSKDIVFEAYSPLGNPSRKKVNPTQPTVLEDSVIKEVAAKHNASPAQVCIAFALHCGMVVIPKTVNPARIIENLRSTELTLDQEDMRRLRVLDRNLRMNSGALLLKASDKLDIFWDEEADSKFEVS